MICSTAEGVVAGKQEILVICVLVVQLWLAAGVVARHSALFPCLKAVFSSEQVQEVIAKCRARMGRQLRLGGEHSCCWRTCRACLCALQIKCVKEAVTGNQQPHPHMPHSSTLHTHFHLTHFHPHWYICFPHPTLTLHTPYPLHHTPPSHSPTHPCPHPTILTCPVNACILASRDRFFPFSWLLTNGRGDGI